MASKTLRSNNTCQNILHLTRDRETRSLPVRAMQHHPLLPGSDESRPLPGSQNPCGDGKFGTVVFKLLAEMGVLRGVVDKQDLLDETRRRAIDDGVYGTQKRRPRLIVEHYHYRCRGKT